MNCQQFVTYSGIDSMIGRKMVDKLSKMMRLIRWHALTLTNQVTLYRSRA